MLWPCERHLSPHRAVSCRRSSARLKTLSLPHVWTTATRAAWRHVLRLDGINRHGERALLVVINRELQDALLDPSRADGYILALVGALEDVRLDVFNGATDGIETIQTVIQVRRARRRSSHARTFD